MKRGDIVTVTGQGDCGKPRPAVVIQSDTLNTADSVLVVLLTSTIKETPLYRQTLQPAPENGPKTRSQVMIDKIQAYPRPKCGAVIGHLSAVDMLALNTSLSVMVGLAD